MNKLNSLFCECQQMRKNKQIKNEICKQIRTENLSKIIRELFYAIIICH